MGVSFTSVKCPECGASLPIEEGRTQIFCSYCGTKVLVTNDNEHIYRHIDEAEITQAETDRIIRLKELEMKQAQQQHNYQTRRILTYVWIGLIFAIIALCLYIWFSSDDGFGAFMALFYIGGPVIGGGAYFLFKVLPEKDNDNDRLQQGWIRFPRGFEPFDDANYETAKNMLINAGFTNVSCVDLHDLTFGIINKPGKIAKITVDGKEITSGGRVYMPDVPIMISYHGK